MQLANVELLKPGRPTNVKSYQWERPEPFKWTYIWIKKSTIMTKVQVLVIDVSHLPGKLFNFIKEFSEKFPRKWKKKWNKNEIK